MAFSTPRLDTARVRRDTRHIHAPAPRRTCTHELSHTVITLEEHTFLDHASWHRIALWPRRQRWEARPRRLAKWSRRMRGLAWPPGSQSSMGRAQRRKRSCEPRAQFTACEQYRSRRPQSQRTPLGRPSACILFIGSKPVSTHVHITYHVHVSLGHRQRRKHTHTHIPSSIHCTSLRLSGKCLCRIRCEKAGRRDEYPQRTRNKHETRVSSG